MASKKEFYNLQEQLLNPPGSYWGNLGYWAPAELAVQPGQSDQLQPDQLQSDQLQPDQLAEHKEPLLFPTGSAQEYALACQALAQKVGDAAQLNTDSVVFDAGFGCGDQLLFWCDHYQISALYGVNLSVSQTTLARQRLSEVGLSAQAENISSDNIDTLSAERWHNYRQQAVNRVLALDCIYHFPQKLHFLQQAASLLKRDGRIAFSDIILVKPLEQQRWIDRAVLRLMLWASDIPLANLHCADGNKQLLVQSGFCDVTQEDISVPVMAGFAAWLPRYKARSRAKAARLNWLKYDVTAAFLAWAQRRQLLGYVVVSAARAAPESGR